MQLWVILLRGVNVGGNHKIVMKTLSAHMTEAGFFDVQTYIQSGNIIARHGGTGDEIKALLGSLIESHFGFLPKILLLNFEDLEASLRLNPFPQANENGKTLHIIYLDEVPINIDWEKMQSLKKPSEAYQLIDKCFYLHTPEGFGTSKLAEKIDSLLKIKGTARNLNTVAKLVEMGHRN